MGAKKLEVSGGDEQLGASRFIWHASALERIAEPESREIASLSKHLPKPLVPDLVRSEGMADDGKDNEVTVKAK
jgi:hypothetical protein